MHHSGFVIMAYVVAGLIYGGLAISSYVRCYRRQKALRLMRQISGN